MNKHEYRIVIGTSPIAWTQWADSATLAARLVARDQLPQVKLYVYPVDRDGHVADESIEFYAGDLQEMSLAKARRART
jgi:hypothetical protein